MEWVSRVCIESQAPLESPETEALDSFGMGFAFFASSKGEQQDLLTIPEICL